MRYQFIKLFWFVVNPVRKIYWFIFRPNTRGVKCLIENEGKFLLVKLNYAHKKWTVPGGGVNRSESFLDAAIRESKEETGIEVINLKYIGSYSSNKEYKKDLVEVYLGNCSNLEFKTDPIEIKDAKWFNRNELPNDCAFSVLKIFEFYDKFRLNQDKKNKYD